MNRDAGGMDKVQSGEKDCDRKNLSAAADGWTGDFEGIRRKNLRDQAAPSGRPMGLSERSELPIGLARF